MEPRLVSLTPDHLLPYQNQGQAHRCLCVATDITSGDGVDDSVEQLSVAVSDLIKPFSTSPLHGSCVSFVAVTRRLFSLQCLRHNAITALTRSRGGGWCFHQTHPSPHDPTCSRRHSSQLTTHESKLQHNAILTFFIYFFIFIFFIL